MWAGGVSSSLTGFDFEGHSQNQVEDIRKKTMTAPQTKKRHLGRRVDGTPRHFATFLCNLHGERDTASGCSLCNRLCRLGVLLNFQDRQHRVSNDRPSPILECKLAFMKVFMRTLWCSCRSRFGGNKWSSQTGGVWPKERNELKV